MRLAVFLVLLALLAVGEAAFPRRRRALARTRRWPANLAVSVLDSVLSRIVLPGGAAGCALFAESRGWGLLRHVPSSQWLENIFAIVALDAALYFQHRLFHAVPVLWRLHRMHHADVDLDVTTGVRFHPGEILLSLGIKGGVILALGASPLSVLIFEVLLNASSMFNHANLNLSRAIDGPLRLIVVTPDMHRVHHSVLPVETNSNFGFNLPWWDRIFHTYRPQPKAGHDEMIIGLEQFRDPPEQGLIRMLTQPFRGKSS